MNGKLPQKNVLSLYQTSPLLLILEFLLLFGVGALAVVLHARMRTPLHIPGHHGLEFMALFILARQYSRLPFSTSIASIGAASMLFIPVLGYKDPFMPLVFAVPGILLDILSWLSANVKRKMIITIIIAGIAYMSIPLTRLIIMGTTGFPYKSLIAHPAYTVVSHLLFGIAGGLLGMGIYKISAYILSKKKTQ